MQTNACELCIQACWCAGRALCQADSKWSEGTQHSQGEHHEPIEAPTLGKSSLVPSSLGTSQRVRLVILQGKTGRKKLVAVIWANVTVNRITGKHQILQETFTETFAPGLSFKERSSRNGSGMYTICSGTCGILLMPTYWLCFISHQTHPKRKRITSKQHTAVLDAHKYCILHFCKLLSELKLARYFTPLLSPALSTPQTLWRWFNRAAKFVCW